MSLEKPLSEDEIAALLPHGRAMCMITEIVDWDENTINCCSNRLVDEKNPLCEKGQLNSVLLIEYAAQAAGIHSALQAQANSLNQVKPAYIGAVKNVEILAEQVRANEPLEIFAECVMNSGGGAIYDVVVQQSSPLLRARLMLSQS